MKHPIFDNGYNDTIPNLVKALSVKNSLYRALNNLALKMGVTRIPQDDLAAILNLTLIQRQIPLDGYNVISIKSDDWKSDITENTLSKLMLKDLNFSMNSGVIQLGSKNIFFGYVNSKVMAKDMEMQPTVFGLDRTRDKPINTLLITILDKITNVTWYFSIPDDEYLFDKIQDEETKSLLSMTITVLLYISMFKKDVNRVNNKKVMCKKSAKRKIPRHTVNVVNLTQSINNRDGMSSRNRSESDKRWIVRGHMRRQYYSKTGEHKPKWIDPYWKGNGKELVEKVYSI